MTRAPERCRYCLRGEGRCNCAEDCGARLSWLTPDCRRAPVEIPCPECGAALASLGLLWWCPGCERPVSAAELADALAVHGGSSLDDVPGSADGRQRDMITARLGVLGITTQAGRLDHVEAIIGHPLAWIGDLSYTEAGRVLETLTEKARAR
jgi:hypothetical protein